VWKALDLERVLARSRAECAAAAAEVARLTHSRSWRLTAPLRRLKQTLDLWSGVVRRNDP
jgi:hypothetical protein